jgi:hypothetical protein
MTEIPKENGVIRDEKGRIVPGSPPLNPNGRPQGSVSIITKIKQIFEDQPEFFDTYVAEVLADPKLRAEIIRQIDGAPKQQVDVESKGTLTVNIVNFNGTDPAA